jgi:hexokinase
MLPTFVFGWPSGKETGNFLALDLGEVLYLLCLNTSDKSQSFSAGGTNLRVCLVTLRGRGEFEITQSKYQITEEQKQEDGQKLFDFCAKCLKTFIDANLSEQKNSEQELSLGFTVRRHFSRFTL